MLHFEEITGKTGFKNRTDKPMDDNNRNNDEEVDRNTSAMEFQGCIDKPGDRPGIDERDQQIEREKYLQSVPTKKNKGEEKREPVLES